MRLLYLVTYIVIFTHSISKASGESLYLKCKETKPALIPTSIYKIPPKSNDAFIWDFAKLNLVKAISAPPLFWIVNLDKKEISSGDNVSVGYFRSFENAKISNEMIYGSYTEDGSTTSLEVSRTSGKLIYQNYISDEKTKKWKELHGGNLPNIFRSEQVCLGSSTPLF
jgi:hypothetical protein